MNGSLNSVFPPMAVTVQLEDELDISRGNMIVGLDNPPEKKQEIDMRICWLSENPMVPGGKYTVKHTTNEVRCIIKEVVYKININTLEKDYEDKSIGLNEIAHIKIKTTKPLYIDSYRKNRTTGSLVLIDESTNNTVCAGMIV